MSRNLIIDRARRALADNPLMMGEELAHTIGCSRDSLRASIRNNRTTLNIMRQRALRKHWMRKP